MMYKGLSVKVKEAIIRLTNKPITVTAKTLAVAKSTSQLINTKAPQVQEWKCVFDCHEGSNPLIVKRKKKWL